MSKRTPFADAAHRYALAGFAVLPVKRGEKHPPLITGGSNAATTNVDIVSEWAQRQPDANLAVATGEPSGGLVVIDLDGEKGTENYGDLVAACGSPSIDPEQPDGWTVRTPRGWHLWLRHAGDVPNSTGQLAKNIDVRGRGGYVMVPPSAVDGRRYVWRHKPDADGPPHLAPEWAWMACTRPAADHGKAGDRPQVPSGPVKDGDRYGRAALASELERVATAREGERNHALNAAAFALGQLCAAGHLPDVRGELIEAAGIAGLDAHEATRTVESGWMAGLSTPRQGGAA